MTAVIESGNLWQKAANSLNQFSTAEILQVLENYQMLPALIKEMVLDEAIANIECIPEEEKTAYEQLVQQYQITSQEALQVWLKQNNLTEERFRYLAVRQLKIEKFKQQEWGQDLESYFYQRKPLLDKVVYSLIRTNDLGVAQEIYFRIQAGERTFGELAKEYSQGPEAQTNGLVGPVELQSIHPILSKILASTQPQTLLPPTQLENWIVVLRLEKMVPCQLDQGLKQRLINERFQAWLKGQIAEQNR